jgi:predicted dehydrogenase
MGEAPPTAIQAIGRKSVFHDWECPDTVSSTYDYRPYTVTFAGAMYGSVDGGGLVFRGTKATLKVSREGLMMFPEGARMIQPMQMTEPDLVMWEKRDGTVEHMQNFVDCIRNRSKPNSDLQSALLAAEVSHLGNRAMLSGKTWRTNER